MAEPRHDRPVALVLGGGNALGAYLAGAYESLHDAGVRPGWVVGASIGAVTGAILAGNPPDRRLARLRQFWEESALHTAAPPGTGASRPRVAYNGLHAAMAAMVTRPGIFRHRFPGLWSLLPWMPGDVALYDHSPLRRTLERLVDFRLLNGGDTRLTVCCVDMETGEEVHFDTARQELGPEHILASTAIAPAFPPVEIGGRLLCDPGYVNNLPVALPFEEMGGDGPLCFAAELFSLRGGRPGSLDSTLERSQDILFASHGRRAVDWLRREYAYRERLRPGAPVATLVHVAYRAAAHEVAAKGFDFSPGSIGDRWAAGRRDMGKGLALLAAEPAGKTGFAYLAP